MSHVIDASALILMLRGEPGSDQVAAALPGARIGVLSLAEAALHFAGLGMPLGEIDLMLRPLPVQRVAVDQQLAWGAAELGAGESGMEVSLAALVAVALAAEARLPLLTADPLAIAAGVRVGVEIVALAHPEADQSVRDAGDLT